MAKRLPLMPHGKPTFGVWLLTPLRVVMWPPASAATIAATRAVQPCRLPPTLICLTPSAWDVFLLIERAVRTSAVRQHEDRDRGHDHQPDLPDSPVRYGATRSTTTVSSG